GGMTAGGGTAIGSLIEGGGAANVGRELGLEGIAPIGAERAFVADPDFVLVGEGWKSTEALRAHPLLSQMRAVKQGHIVAMPAALVGGGLAVVGAALQSVFRNPMADSGLLGVGSGAALGAVLAVKLGWGQTFLALPVAAFAGAMAAVLAVYVLAHAAGRASLHGLLLTGLAVAALAGAGTSVLLVATEEFRVKTVLFWLAGGLEGRSWTHLQLGGALILAGAALLFALARP